MPPVGFERKGRPQGALQAVQPILHSIHAIENFGQDNVQLRIGLFGQQC